MSLSTEQEARRVRLEASLDFAADYKAWREMIADEYEARRIACGPYSVAEIMAHDRVKLSYAAYVAATALQPAKDAE